jgi:hypothetical protein
MMKMHRQRVSKIGTTTRRSGEKVDDEAVVAYRGSLSA